MKKIISLAVMLLMIITMLTGCMNTVPTVSENGAVAYVYVKIGDQQISLSADKQMKVIVTSYSKVNQDGDLVPSSKSLTIFKDTDIKGKQLDKALEDVIKLELISSDSEFSFDVTIKNSSITESDATKKAVEAIKATTKDAFKGSDNYKITYSNGKGEDEVLADSNATDNTSSTLENTSSVTE